MRHFVDVNLASAGMLVAGLAAGVALLYFKPTAAWGRRLLALLAIGYLGLSVPALTLPAARLLAWGYRPLQSAAQADEATGIVILGGGARLVRGRADQVELLDPATAVRVLEAVRVYRLLGHPWVIPSGGVADPNVESEPEAVTMRRLLLRLGVPAGRILLESRSRNTYDEALDVPPILRAHAIRTFVLVTSPTHMRRSMLTFAAQGLHAIPSIATETFAGRPDVSYWWPSEEGLHFGQATLHEYLGLVYYWAHGWLR
ncbi:MAG TPA: YdcF family protein [Vicinamibacterales bacterium]|nr:YdcF family protein [Vicinamibacterales bacterium]